MILKVRNSNKGWSYFEGEQIYTSQMDLQEVLDSDVVETILSPNGRINRGHLVTIVKEKQNLSFIINDGYLLNNDGKTIDRLN